jgi:hypothetical protein
MSQKGAITALFWVSGLLVSVACRYVSTDAPEEQTASVFWREAAGNIYPQNVRIHLPEYTVS